MSKYPATSEHKVDLGPVYAVNPRYVKYVCANIFGGGVDTSFLDVILTCGVEISSELDTEQYTLERFVELKRLNPAIVTDVKRY